MIRGVPCHLSHNAFDVTCMLSLHQLRLISNNCLYSAGHVTCDCPGGVSAGGGVHPPDPETDLSPSPLTEWMTHACENITFPQLLRAVKI